MDLGFVYYNSAFYFPLAYKLRRGFSSGFEVSLHNRLFQLMSPLSA